MEGAGGGGGGGGEGESPATHQIMPEDSGVQVHDVSYRSDPRGDQQLLIATAARDLMTDRARREGSGDRIAGVGKREKQEQGVLVTGGMTRGNPLMNEYERRGEQRKRVEIAEEERVQEKVQWRYGTEGREEKQDTKKSKNQKTGRGGTKR